jgi:hypothetical protein
VTFTLAANPTGGRLVGADPEAHAVRWEPGPAGGTDVLRARRDDGTFAEVAVPVVEHPVPHHVARFGATDVWWIRFEGVRDPTHGFASDFDAALAAAGLRAPSSRGARGTAADEFARFFVRRETVSRAGALFGLLPDGRPGPDALAISFPFDRPETGHAAPADGTAVPAFPGGYNVFGVQHGGVPPTLGFSILDERGNPSLESVVATESNPFLGAFVEEVFAQASLGWGNASLPSDPVSDADVPALRALAYGLPFEGGRHDELRRVGEALAQSLAYVVAHEIAHALGLLHPVAPGSLMNPPFGSITSPAAPLSFSDPERDALEEALPGPGR